MPDEQWAAVDALFDDLLVKPDEALNAALHASAEHGLPAIQVAPNQGKMLHLLARAIKARAILEIGTLGGYSTIWLARALPPHGHLVTLELNPAHADVARANLERAGVSGKVEVRVGNALDTLPELQAAGIGPFDLVFIDADKQSTSEYFDWAVRLGRSGTLIVVDNVVRHGTILDTASDDENVRGMQRFNAALHADLRVSATVIQTVGVKGHDGFALALVG
jgi:predicted O-methyltransferase YrrM